MNRITHWNKFKAAAALLVIMVLLLLNNVTGRKSFLNIRDSFSSMYKDRLMPATYIFNLSDHLYQNRLLLESDEHNPMLREELEAHDAVIASLIGDYEGTYLTKEEEKEWQSFKKHLSSYNLLRANPASAQATMVHFTGAVKGLHALSQIQVGEGSALHSNSRAIIDGTNTFSEFEISLVVLLGIFTILMISLPEKPFIRSGQFSMN